MTQAIPLQLELCPTRGQVGNLCRLCCRPFLGCGETPFGPRGALLGIGVVLNRLSELLLSLCGALLGVGPPPDLFGETAFSLRGALLGIGTPADLL